MVDAWAVATSADGGTWRIENQSNGNPITNTVTMPAADQVVARATSIDNANSSIPSGFGVTLAGTGTTLDASIYVLAVPE